MQSPRPVDRRAVLFAQFLHPQDSDHVLQFLVAGQQRPYLCCDGIMLQPYAFGREQRAVGLQWVDRRIDTQARLTARKDRRRIQVGERRHDSRVGQVVGWHVHRLYRRHAASAGRRDAFLQLAHFAAQGGLVAHSAGEPSQERRHLRAGLNVAENVVDEHQHRAAFIVAEVLCHRQRGERHPQPCARRFVHLPEHEYCALQHSAALHLQP